MDSIESDLLKSGKILPVMEEFYSLQGEGYHTGRAAYFIRIGGCDVGCSWCDVKESWDASLHPLTPVDEVVARAADYPAKAVVVTGGEPLLYNLNYLCHQLERSEVKRYLETSGSEPLTGSWNWICLSPKKNSPPLDNILHAAHELKVIVSDYTDLYWAESFAEKVLKECLLFLQPEWSRRQKAIPLIIDYIKLNPLWMISLQSHKYMNIP